MSTYTLPELTDLAGRALDALGVQVGNRRVRQRPDARTVRYYSQVGLVDRPLPSAGREATYGRRHLVQLVAVKRLQEAGVTLAEIQRRLAGASEAELLAAIGPAAEAALSDVAAAAPASPPDKRAAPVRPAAFWRARPASVDGAASPTAAPPTSSESSDDGVRRMLVVRLADGVELAVEHPAEGVDVEALRTAARPLLRYLRGTTGHDMTGDLEDGV